MRILSCRWGLAFLLWGGVSAQQQAAKVPEMHGISFAGEAVSLPKDLQGRAGVLVVGFTQGSRDAMTAWGKQLATDYFDAKDVAYYDMPVLAGVPRILRGYVTGKVKDSVSERGRSHFVPIVENEVAWRALTQYKSDDDAYVVVVNGQGGVVWQTHGAFSEGAYNAMKVQVERLRWGIGHLVH